MLNLTLEEKQEVMEALKEKIPKMTRRQLECWVLNDLGFTQEESGVILNCSQRNVGIHLQNLWNTLEDN